MFYSRRIGLDDDFNPVPIIGGLRLVGRKGPWDAGLINMQTAKSDSLPSENFGVLRLKRKIINANSYLGGILTSRIGLDGSYKEAYGFDALIRIMGDEYLSMVWGQTFESGMDRSGSLLDNARYHVALERRRQAGIYYRLSLSGSGEHFDPGMGFQGRNDYHRPGLVLNYIWLMGEDSPIMRHGPGIEASSFISQSRGKYETMEYNLTYKLQLKNFAEGQISLGYNYEHVFRLFKLSDEAFVPLHIYRFPKVEAYFMTPMTRPLWMMVEYEGGGYYDGRYISISAEPTWSLSSSLNLTGAYVYNNVVFPERDQQFRGHIGRLKLLYMYSTKLSASAFIQYNSAVHSVNSNFRLRYNPREGNDLYIVYNEGSNTDLDRDTPLNIPRMADRTIMLKYTYTFCF